MFLERNISKNIPKVINTAAVVRSDQAGVVFNLQRYSIQDGPGIRTTVFTKGCPLHCEWCSNPESWLPVPEVMTEDTRCLRCGRCMEICPLRAITIDEYGRKIDRNKCNNCLECAKVCPSGAITITGNYMTVNEIVGEVVRDRLFYQNSGGGMTISGGEALVQWEFAAEIFKACKEKYIHTALDTTGYAPWDRMEKVIKYVDLVLFDLKHMNPIIHKERTGVSNELILANIRKAASMVRVWLRIPVIPGFNDSHSDMQEIAEFASSLALEKVSLLPYHSWGESKYHRLGKTYPMHGIESPSEQQMMRIKELVESFGLKVSIGD